MAERKKPLILLPYCVERVDELKRLAEKEGFQTEIIRYDDDIPNIIREYSPSCILGVACSPKVAKVGKYLDSIGQEYQAIPLDCSGCLKVTGEKTKINEDKYIQALKDLRQKENKGLLGKIIPFFAGGLLLIIYIIFNQVTITGNVILNNTMQKSPLIIGVILILLTLFFVFNKKKIFYIFK